MIVQAAVVALQSGKTQSSLKKLIAFLDSLKCRFEPSCAPKLLAAAAIIGVKGYRKSRGTDWWYFLPTGEHITWHLPASDGQTFGISAQTWYATSGLNDEMRTVGKVSDCCASAKWPPSEFFPMVGAFEGLVEVEIEGFKIAWDKAKWNETSVRQAIREHKLAAQAGPTGTSTSAGTGTGTSDSGASGLPTLAGIGALFFIIRKLL